MSVNNLFTSTQGYSSYNNCNNLPSSSFVSNSFDCNLTNTNIFSVCHQNIRSLRKNFDKCIANLNSFKHLPSIIFLSETWIYDYELKLYNIPNYICIGCCNNNYRAGGVCAFYDCNLDCEYELVSLHSADIIKLLVKINNVKYIFVYVFIDCNPVQCHHLCWNFMIYWSI